MDTKIKGKEEIYLLIDIGFTYELVNKTIAFIKKKNYDRKWATASINLSSLINNGKTYDFYINEKTELELVVKDIVRNIKKYAFEFWDGCNSMEKYYNKLLYRDDITRESVFSLDRPEWNLLALSIILGKGSYKEITDDYKEDFEKRKHSIEDIKRRIESYGVMEESYQL